MGNDNCVEFEVNTVEVDWEVVKEKRGCSDCPQFAGDVLLYSGDYHNCIGTCRALWKQPKPLPTKRTRW